MSMSSGADSKIWVVVQHRQGRLHRMSIEALAAGQQLASELGSSVAAVVAAAETAELATSLAKFELAAVLAIEATGLEDYTPGGYVAALGPAIREHGPELVIFPHTYQTVDYMARLSHDVEAALVPEIIGFEREGEGIGGVLWQRPIMGGKLHSRFSVEGEGTIFVSVQSGVFPADTAVGGSAEVEALTGAPEGSVEPDREILGVEQAGGEQVDLTKADIIVAVGRGVGGADKLGPCEALARELGAELGASRPVIDSGWLPRDRQIGSSGQTVAPKLYVATGISGAIQHLVGMKGSSCVVAINKDESAPIFGIADYGLVGDLHEIVPALTSAIAAAKAD